MTVNDLRVPTKPGSTMQEVVRRIIGGEPNNTVPIEPGWDWTLVVDGLKGARGRYEQSLSAGTGMAARVALGEALWWVAAADEFIRTRISCGMSTKEYYKELIKHEGGARLAGLVYARNRAGHQLARLLLAKVTHSEPHAVKYTDGSERVFHIRAQMYYGLRPFDPAPETGYLFAEQQDLPPADSNHSERYGRDLCYTRHVAKQPVGQVLEAIEAALQQAIRWEETSPNMINVSIAMTSTPAP